MSQNDVAVYLLMTPALAVLIVIALYYSIKWYNSDADELDRYEAEHGPGSTDPHPGGMVGELWDEYRAARREAREARDHNE